MTFGPLDRLQRPLRDLRISVIDRCNFRCSYCMPAEIFGPDYAFLPKKELLSADEILTVATAFKTLGVQKIRLTGGEPLLRKDLVEIVKRLRSETCVEDISLTTNGILLPRYASALSEAGLKRINVSLDSLDAGRFAELNGNRAKPEAVLKGIDAALAAGLSVKINMVAKLGVNECDIVPMLSYFRKKGISVRFIEYMDVGESNQWVSKDVVSADRILNIIDESFDFEPIEPSYVGEVAKRYRFLDTKSEFGIITSISKPFCSDCNRIRLSADGKLFTCLFASQGTDIKDMLRSDLDTETLQSFLRSLWLKRDDQYSNHRDAAAKGKRGKIEMSYIGG